MVDESSEDERKIQDLLEKNHEITEKADIVIRDPLRIEEYYELTKKNIDVISNIADLRGKVPEKLHDYNIALNQCDQMLKGLENAKITYKTTIKLESEIQEKKSQIERIVERLESRSEEVEAEKLPGREKIIREISKLKRERSTINNEKGKGYVERLKRKIELSKKIGEDYQKLAELSEFEDTEAMNYRGSPTNFAEAGDYSEKIGENRHASKLYVNTARAYKKIGDKDKTSLFAHKARFARRATIRSGLENVNGMHIIILFILGLILVSPRLTGGVIGVGLGFPDYLSGVLFVLALGLEAAKIYAGRN